MSLNFLKFKKGFTTLELMVVIGIFVIMTGVVLSNLPGFRDQSAVGLVAQQIALVARQAQVYGNSGREFSGNSVERYGLDFDLNQANGLTDSSFAMFADFNNNYDYNTSPTPELVEIFSMQGGIKISDPNGLARCTTTTTCNSATRVTNVLFRRAYPDAIFSDGVGAPQTNVVCTVVRLESIRNPSIKKDVVIWSTGYIYTKSVPVTLNFSC